MDIVTGIGARFLGLAKSTFPSLSSQLPSDEQTAGIVLLSTLVAIFIASFFIFFKGTAQKDKRDRILLLGPCGSGKSALFFKMRDGNIAETHTSMRSNETDVTIQARRGTRLVHLVDVPGHARLRHAAQQHIAQARSIVFLLDATSNAAQIREGAEYLYDLMLDDGLARARVSLLVACNKSDLAGASKPAAIQKSLETEIDKLRITRSAQPDQSDERSGAPRRDMFLGVEGEPFRFDQHAPFEVRFGSSSVVKDSADDNAISNFLSECF